MSWSPFNCNYANLYYISPHDPITCLAHVLLIEWQDLPIRQSTLLVQVVKARRPVPITWASIYIAIVRSLLRLDDTKCGNLTAATLH